jgi:hypothetical protein
VLGSIIVTSRNNSGTLQADGFPGTIGEVSPLVAQTERERSQIASRMQRVIVKESDERCECSEPATLRGKPSHCINCGGRL